MAKPKLRKYKIEDTVRGHGRVLADWMKLFSGIVDVYVLHTIQHTSINNQNKVSDM